MNNFGNQRSATFSLVAINVAVFFISYLIPSITRYLAIYPYGIFEAGYVWTPVTYMFVHGGFTHLLFNTIFMIFAAPAVEARMGFREFLAYYLISGALAGLFSVFAYMTNGINTSIVGASGALYAVLLAFATYYPRARVLLFYVLPIKAPYALLLFTAIDLFSHLRGRGGVAYLTHLSGLAFGFLYFLIRLKMNPIKEMREGR